MHLRIRYSLHQSDFNSSMCALHHHKQFCTVVTSDLSLNKSPCVHLCQMGFTINTARHSYGFVMTADGYQHFQRFPNRRREAKRKRGILSALLNAREWAVCSIVIRESWSVRDKGQRTSVRFLLLLHRENCSITNLCHSSKPCQPFLNCYISHDVVSFSPSSNHRPKR